VCPVCWAQVTPHAGGLCPTCGEAGVADAAPCLSCRATPPLWQAATSYGPYVGVLRDLVVSFKNGRRDELAVPLAELLLAAWRRSGWPRPDCVAPVPMTAWRRLRRGFNQSELLARRLAGALGTGFVHALRRSGGQAQFGRTRAQRLSLPASTFTPRGPLAGEVLLVDDVLTTGATATACATALLRSGASAVRVITVARTLRPGRIP
jgi:ComF family protein